MKLFATLLICVSAATAYAQVFEDHTRVRRLDSSALRNDQVAANCPAGSVLSGGACTPMIQNQGAYGRAWTSYFLGQRKCYTNPARTMSACAQILSDGAVRWEYNGHYVGQSSTPIELQTVGFQNYISILGIQQWSSAWPTGFNPLNGTPPTDWAISADANCPAC